MKLSASMPDGSLSVTKCLFSCHIYKQEAVSIDKHIAFGLFFAAPLAGCALAWLSGQGHGNFTRLSQVKI